MTKEQAESAIKRAWIASIASVLVCIVTVLLVMFEGTGYVYGPKPWSLPQYLDSVLAELLAILGLAYAVYKRSRFFATILFLWFCTDHIEFLLFDVEWWSGAERAYWLVLVIVFGYFFLQGLRGTFAYRRLRDSEKAA